MKTQPETTAAAILLCAGKGTRMNDGSRNKVCFDCAGVPVIRRIIDNMRAGGVGRFVVVVGYRAESVMACLDGIPGVVYAYQREQKGTGHAALCGLNVLRDIGYAGPVIISMGDKIIAPGVVAGLVARAGSAQAVWGVQPVAANPGGGRVVTDNGKPFGVVELADAALLAVSPLPPESRAEALRGLGLNEKKAAKVLAAAGKGGGVRRRRSADVTSRRLKSSPRATPTPASTASTRTPFSRRSDRSAPTTPRAKSTSRTHLRTSRRRGGPSYSRSATPTTCSPTARARNCVA